MPRFYILALLLQRWAAWLFPHCPPPLNPRVGCSLGNQLVLATEPLPASLGGGCSRILRLRCSRVNPAPPRLHIQAPPHRWAPRTVGPAHPRPFASGHALLSSPSGLRLCLPSAGIKGMWHHFNKPHIFLLCTHTHTQVCLQTCQEHNR